MQCNIHFHVVATLIRDSFKIEEIQIMHVLLKKLCNAHIFERDIFKTCSVCKNVFDILILILIKMYFYSTKHF